VIRKQNMNLCNLLFLFYLNATVSLKMDIETNSEQICDKLTLFESAIRDQDLARMDEYFQETRRNNYYLDVALEEGKEKIVDYFLNKGYQPSLFANQMARLNGHISLSNKIESYIQYRNKINIKDVFYKYDSKIKSIYWSPLIPLEHRF
jgi:hypothetical protein